MLAAVLAVTAMTASAAPASLVRPGTEPAPLALAVVPPAAVDARVDVGSAGVVRAQVTRVPEPGVYAMVIAGLAVVVWKVRRHRRR